uniref:hypothetical protein n=1 Tax=Acinetobacter baumannii TaxID=470 RepID=UPI001C066AFE
HPHTFYTQKTPPEILRCDWISVVCSSDMPEKYPSVHTPGDVLVLLCLAGGRSEERRVWKDCKAACRSSWCGYD